MLANKRKHKVIGRTNNLTASTTLKKETKYQGEPTGKSLETDIDFISIKKIVESQRKRDIEKLKDKVVVIG